MSGRTATIDRVAARRSLHLVDLENLLGDPRASGPPVGWALERYLEVAGWRSGDLVYLAANPRLTMEIAASRPVPAALHAARGPDGADLALLAHAAPDFVARRARRLVIGSGDHIFAERAAAARDLGVRVVIISRPDALSRELRALGCPVLPFDPAGVPACLAGVAA